MLQYGEYVNGVRLKMYLDMLKMCGLDFETFENTFLQSNRY